MIKKLLILTIAISLGNLKPNVNSKSTDQEVIKTIDINKITIEKIREEVQLLEKGILGKSSVNPENSPYLYKLIENLANKMELAVPEIIIAKGLFTPTTINEVKLDSLMEMLPSLFMIYSSINQLASTPINITKPTNQNSRLDTIKYKNINIQFAINVLLKSIFNYVFFNTISGQMKTNAFASKGLRGKGKISLGINLINNLNIDELECIIGHELAHIKHNHASKLSFIYLVLSYLIQNPKIEHKWRNLAIAVPLLNLIKREAEKQADRTSGKITNKPKHLASALNKITEYSKKIVEYPIEKELPEPANETKIQSMFSSFTYAILLGYPTNKERISYLNKASKA